jgi:dihydrofolate synthase/folylpolyglutamate synthase
MITYKEAEEWLLWTEKLGSKPGLEAISHLLERMGSPHKSFKSIHITGTNGKGSTAAMTASILAAAGYKVGLFTSPHLSTFRESIAVNGEYVSRGKAAEIIETIKPIAEEMKETPGLRHPTYFEVLTALAFQHFREEGVDFAVVEVGMGGVLDATNVLSSLVSVITNVSLEHTRWLGGTVLEIAEKKAGIIKPGSVLITATKDDTVYALLKKICSGRNARAFRVGADITYEREASSLEGQRFMVKGIRSRYELFIPLLGEHQLVNASTAVGAVEALAFHGITVSEEAIAEGLRAVRWPGRLEVVQRNPFIVLDGAKDLEAARAAVEAVRREFTYGRLIVVVSISSDKDIGAMMERFAEIADYFIATSHRVAGRAVDPGRLVSEANRMSKPSEIAGSVVDAINRAKEIARPEDLILIIGSVFLAGQAREVLLGPIS